MVQNKMHPTGKSFVVAAAADAGAGANNEPSKKLKSVNILSDDTILSHASVISPLDFDKFITWVAKQWCASTDILITRKLPEQYQRRKSVYKTRSKSFSHEAKSIKALSHTNPPIASPIPLETDPDKSLYVFRKEVVPITTYYDARKQLIEIAFVGCKLTVSRRIIQAMSLCVPHHSALYRFTFRKSGLTDILIYEINKLLPISNITEVCFDDSNVKEGNYYILLEQYSQLKYLSLNRCCINDEICKKIFKNIDFDAPAANTLKLLELGSNEITDEGAKYIGQVLRVNRSLMHLNLSGNKITDEGFRPIIECLMDFPLRPDELKAMRRRKIRYLQNKMEVYIRCLMDLKYGKGPIEDLDNSTSKRKLLANKRIRKKPRKATYQSIADVADAMARGIAGAFQDPFAPEYLVYKDDGEVICSTGNFSLCSLNVAYNNLELPSLQRLLQVLSYQDHVPKGRKETGLIRVVLDGNYIPERCDELDQIDFYFKKIIHLRSFGKGRASFFTRRVQHSSSAKSSAISVDKN